MSRLILRDVRLSFVHVDNPQSIEEGGEKKYSVSIIIPKSDTKQIALVEKAIKEAIASGKEKLGKYVASKLKTPLRDGDDERPDDGAYADAMFFSASSSRKPGIISKSGKEMDDEEGYIYSGCFAHVSVNMYAFSVSGNKGIAAGLNNIMFRMDGERLSGGPSAEEDFADFFEEDDLDDLL